MAVGVAVRDVVVVVEEVAVAKGRYASVLASKVFAMFC